MGALPPRAVLTPVIRVLWMDSTAVPRFEAVPLHNRVTLRTATGKEQQCLAGTKAKADDTGCDSCGSQVSAAGSDSCSDPNDGFYSNSGVETACTNIPNGAFTSHGGTSPTGCAYTCNQGFVDGQHSSPKVRSCTAPQSGHFANSNRQEQQCLAGTKAKADDTGCDSCGSQVSAAGSDSCSDPNDGFYSNSGVETACTDIPNGAFTSHGGTSPTGCAYTCNQGFVDGQHSSPKVRSCTAPQSGHFANSNRQEQQCLAGTKAKADDTGCDSCGSQVSAAGSDSCSDPNDGFYSNSGVETACTDIPNGAFTSHGGTSATGCAYTCNQGFVDGQHSSPKVRSCTAPQSGHFADSDRRKVQCAAGTKAKADDTGCDSCGSQVSAAGSDSCSDPNDGFYSNSGVETACTNIPNGAFTSHGGTSPTGCAYTCNQGFVDGQHSSPKVRSCTAPQSGHFANSNRQEQQCLAGTKAKADDTGCDSCGSQVSAAGSDSCSDPNDGFYSNSGVETACTDIPNGAFTSHGGTSATGCAYTCNQGFVDGQHSSPKVRSCTAPQSGHFADSDRRKVQCAAGTKAKADDTGCDSCGSQVSAAGSDSCRDPNDGFYSNSGVETACTNIPNGAFTSHGGTSPTGCTYTCNDGFVDGQHSSPKVRSCRAPGQGHYADGGVEKDCTPTTITDGTYITPSGGETQAQACEFTCVGGKVKNAADRQCDDAGEGVYVVNSIDHNCWADDNDANTDSKAESAAELSSRDGTAWAASQSGVIKAPDCKLASCVEGHIFNNTKTNCSPCTGSTVTNQGQTACVAPTLGHYSNSGVEEDCTPITDGSFTSHGGTSPTGCTYTCNDGFVDGQHSSPKVRSCTAPQSGHFANSNRQEQQCLAGTKAKADDTGCDSCGSQVSAAGSDSCSDPNDGFYSNSGVETACTDIPNGAFTSHGGTSATGCAYTCNQGFVDGQHSSPKVRSCTAPQSGHFADSDRRKVQCAAGTKAKADDTGCDSCGSQVSAAGSDSCSDPNDGFYSNSGVETACTNIPNGAFTSHGGTSPTGCAYTCNQGFVDGQHSSPKVRSCTAPQSGHFANSNRQGTMCSGHKSQGR